MTCNETAIVDDEYWKSNLYIIMGVSLWFGGVGASSPLISNIYNKLQI